MAINLANALTVLNAEGIDITADFHTLRSMQVDILVTLAKEQGYRKPANASGSNARMYWQSLQRKYNASK